MVVILSCRGALCGRPRCNTRCAAGHRAATRAPPPPQPSWALACLPRQWLLLASGSLHELAPLGLRLEDLGRDDRAAVALAGVLCKVALVVVLRGVKRDRRQDLRDDGGGVQRRQLLDDRLRRRLLGVAVVVDPAAVLRTLVVACGNTSSRQRGGRVGSQACGSAGSARHRHRAGGALTLLVQCCGVVDREQDLQHRAVHTHTHANRVERRRIRRSPASPHGRPRVH